MLPQPIYGYPRPTVYGINIHQNNINNYHIYPISYPQTFPMDNPAYSTSYGNQYYTPGNIHNYSGMFNRINNSNFHGQPY